MASLSACCAAASLLPACASSQPEPIVSDAGTHHQGSLNPPVIISGNPQRDGRAFNASSEELSDADWKVLEQLGPRPIWEKVTGAHSRLMRSKDAGDTTPAEKNNSTASVGFEREGGPKRGNRRGRPSKCTTTTDARPTTAPSTQPAVASAAAPTTQPATTQPTILSDATIDTDDLPVQEIDLTNDKVRLIWTLRSYGGSSVKSTKAADGNTTRRNIDVAAPDLEPLIKVLTPALGSSGTVQALPKENTLVITCDRAMRASVIDLLSRLDVPQRQVEITAKIFEVSQDFDFQQGAQVVLNRLVSDGSQQLISSFSARRFLDAVAGGSGPVQGSVLHLMQSFADAGISVDVSFQLLAESGLIKVVSEPRMTVAVGQTGYLLAGQELPIQSVNIANNVVTTSTTYKPVGVQLYITPQAAGDEQVKLHTISVVSSVSGFSTLPSMDNSNQQRTLINPIIDSREAETQVVVGNGDTLVISGLRMVRTATRENKVPGLGDLPVLGWAFKNHRSQQQLTDLYFFVTPVLLETGPMASAN